MTLNDTPNGKMVIEHIRNGEVIDRFESDVNFIGTSKLLDTMYVSRTDVVFPRIITVLDGDTLKTSET